MRILLVDDEEELVSTLAERLSYRGLDTDWACSAKEALFKSGQQVYDIAVLDIKMPETDGFKLKRQLQENNPTMKFIFMTGHGSDNYYHIGSAETGREFYLVKPVNIELLIAKLNEVLQKQGGV
ncbi:MAG: response regulator [Pseudomonadota bacterium]